MHRPVCHHCRKPGERLFPWPLMPGSVTYIPSRRRCD
jgi:hypothetical protein